MAGPTIWALTGSPTVKKRKYNWRSKAYLCLTRLYSSKFITTKVSLKSIFDVKREDYIFRATPLTFDPSIVDIFIGLSSSACLVTFSSTIRQSPKLVAGVLADSRCTVVQMTPSFYRQIRGHCLLNSVQTLIFGGEQFPYADKDLMSLIENGKKLINIYGITEMSCWASYHFVTLENLRTGRIPIGEPLNDTKLTIKPSDDCLSFTESDTRWTQTGLHNDKQIFSFATNDIVEHDNGSIYYVGRKTFTQKRMGVMVSVEYIEKTALQSNLVSECGGFFKEDGTLILLGSFTTDDGPSKLSEYLQTHLPPHFIPNKIRRSYSNLPLNENGKIDRSQLARLYSTETDEFGLDIPLIIDTIWKEILHKESDNTANFISDGGNSLLALTFVENLRSQSKTIDSTTALDILLHNTKNDLVNYLKMGKQVENNVLNEPKDYVSKENIHQLDEIISIQRCSKIFVHNYGEKMFEYCLSLKEHGIDIKHKRITKATTKTTELQLKWKSSLEKCIDASPLIVIINDKQQLVIVGSHAHLLNAYEIENGTLIWSFKTNDRIEAGATLSRTGEYVLVGDYSGMLYIIDCHYGQLYGTYQCGGLIKTIPCAHRSLDLVYVGSHDHYLHAINIQNRNSTCVWKYFLDSSCASSPPLSADDSCLYVATLKGEVYSLDANTGICKWKSAVSKPIFSSILVWNELLIFGCVDQNIYCLNEKTGEQKWYLSIGGPIFSSPSAVYDITLDRVLITFGCHDKKVYAVQIIHNQPLIAWEHSFESTVYASLFGFERHDQWLTIAASTDGCLQILDTHTGKQCFEQQEIRLRRPYGT
ncbi:unnamed protein product [Didymodactylos carnosus]|uniref:Uncharacterized protein n=1 Tax=Didymodactylos carnosus TaxID=1234261 RepID=A0A814NM11_9BILA|nr:unnamed protein product [Didymodactylos carnosus]CAF3859489.1 unnamed protein product [Didymodactylos carnosus]